MARVQSLAQTITGHARGNCGVEFDHAKLVSTCILIRVVERGLKFRSVINCKVSKWKTVDGAALTQSPQSAYQPQSSQQ